MTPKHGLKPNKLWHVIDSSKLIDYLSCPRMFFYKHILGWRSDRPNNHLIFGRAMHRALEHLTTNGYTTKAVGEAFEIFLHTYREHFPSSTDEVFSPKTPENALIALHDYAEKYKNDLSLYDLLHTEVHGIVSIGKYDLHFRMDAILRRKSDGLIFAREIKTKGGSFTRAWIQQWTTSLQVGTYTYALTCYFNPSHVRGTMIDGIGFLKTRIDLERFPVWRTDKQIAQWLSTAWYWYDSLMDEFDLLEVSSPEDEIMNCFPQNPTSCSNYFGCPMIDFCFAWINPLQHAYDLPTGMMVDFWDPAAEEAKIVLKPGEKEKEDGAGEERETSLGSQTSPRVLLERLGPEFL